MLASAVYTGHWLKEAREFSSRLAPVLATRPVWLFSSGPTGDPSSFAQDAVDVATALAATERWTIGPWRAGSTRTGSRSVNA